MNRFQRDPFTAGLAIASALLVLGAIYFAYSAHSSFSEKAEAHEASVATLNRLRSARPFPDKNNLEAVTGEVQQTKQLLARLSSVIREQSAPLDTSLTPQKFQDVLNAKVGELAKQAAQKGTVIVDDFYLGFDEYRTQPPSPAAAPLLGQQLESIANVTSLIINAGVSEISSVERQRLPAESSPPPGEADQSPLQASPVTMIPFDISFVCNHSAFRSAFEAVVSATPLVFIRLVSVANSQPAPPPKAPPAAEISAAEEAPVERIPVLFGRETLNVKLRLASVSATPTSAQP